LHVLSAPPAFVLSQDQTLREDLVSPRPVPNGRAGKAGTASGSASQATPTSRLTIFG
jgi:hypothetical protein